MPMLDYQEIFGQRLTRAMEKREVSVKELSKMAGVPLKSVYSYRAGDRPPTYHNLVSIGKALHVSLDWLCGMRVKEGD